MDKLKVDIITLQGVQNYGSVLQAFATKKVFEKHNLEVRIINYVKADYTYSNLYHTWAGNNPIKAVVMAPTIKRWKTVFDKFCHENLNLSGPVYTTIKDFDNFPLKADLYCTGSDQVWNSKWNNGILPELYLSFVPASKYKFSFAASFGQSKLSEDEVKKTEEWIRQYRYISVREDSAKQILNDQYQYTNVTQLIDPTLTLSADAWRKFESSRQINDDYILIGDSNQ